MSFGGFSFTEAAFTATSTGLTGVGFCSLPALTAAASGASAVAASSTVVFPMLSAAATGVIPVVGAGTAAFPALTAAMTGIVIVAAHGAVFLPMFEVEADICSTTPCRPMVFWRPCSDRPASGFASCGRVGSARTGGAA